MRLVSWNCCDAFQRKFGHLERLRPDIAVIQEVRPECLQFAAVQDRSVWMGDPGQKGLAVIAYGDWKISAAPLTVEREVVLASGSYQRFRDDPPGGCLGRFLEGLCSADASRTRRAQGVSRCCAKHHDGGLQPDGQPRQRASGR